MMAMMAMPKLKSAWLVSMGAGQTAGSRGDSHHLPITHYYYYYTTNYYVYVYNYDDYGISRIAVYRFLNRLYATPPFEYPSALAAIFLSYCTFSSPPFTDILYYIILLTHCAVGFLVLCHCHVKAEYTPRSLYLLS